MARRKAMDYTITPDSVIVSRLHYPDGDDGAAAVAEQVTFNVADVPAQLHVSGEGEEATYASLAAYGLSQLLQDRVSSVDGAESKLEKMHEVFELIKEGKWKAVRASVAGERKTAIPSEVAEGFARYVQSLGKDMDAATATVWLQSKTAEERKAIRQKDEVKAFIQQVKDEAAAKAEDLDLEDLLG